MYIKRFRKPMKKSRPPKGESKPPSKGGSLANIAHLVGDYEVPPDISFKMSKKIAQLTKVIFYLNTKSEDHETEVTSLTNAYENEIELVFYFFDLIFI